MSETGALKTEPTPERIPETFPGIPLRGRKFGPFRKFRAGRTR